MKRKTQPDLKVSEVASAFNCSEKCVRRMVADRVIRAYRIGTAIRIPASEIERIRRGD